jgi:hypothetical protein
MGRRTPCFCLSTVLPSYSDNAQQNRFPRGKQAWALPERVDYDLFPDVGAAEEDGDVSPPLKC